MIFALGLNVIVDFHAFVLSTPPIQKFNFETEWSCTGLKKAIKSSIVKSLNILPFYYLLLFINFVNRVGSLPIMGW